MCMYVHVHVPVHTHEFILYTYNRYLLFHLYNVYKTDLKVLIDVCVSQP
jgi:hypothetical protein